MFWDDIAFEYDKNMVDSSQGKLVLNNLKDFLKNIDVKSVVDVGSGTGHILKELFRKETKITAIEPSFNMYFFLTNNLKGYNSEVLMDYAELVDLSETPDLLLFSLSLNWLNNPLSVLDRFTASNPKYVLIAKQEVESISNLGIGSPQIREIQSNYKSVDEKELLLNKGYVLQKERTDPFKRFDGSSSGDSLVTRLYEHT